MTHPFPHAPSLQELPQLAMSSVKQVAGRAVACSPRHAASVELWNDNRAVPSISIRYERHHFVCHRLLSSDDGSVDARLLPKPRLPSTHTLSTPCVYVLAVSH